MLQIQNITDAALQKRTLFLNDGSSVAITMYYVPMQLGWFITNLTYGTFILTNLRVTNQPNMLRQWKNILPFGLACFSKNDREPTQQQDFLSLSSKMYLLTQADVDAYEAYLSE